MKRTTTALNSPTRKPATTLALLAFALLAAAPILRAETCTTQSALDQPDRDGLADSARTFATLVQSNDTARLRASSVAEVVKDFNGLQYLVASTAPKLAGGVIAVEQVYLLDATSLKRNPDGSASDAQFFCSLNRSTMEAQFTIPALPPGMYGFAMVTVAPPPGATRPEPWRLSFLLRRLLSQAPHRRRPRRPLVLDPGPPVGRRQAALERVALLPGCPEPPHPGGLRLQHPSGQAAD
jgi:hypothetical protein